ncbi:hypothetical protein [Pseudonocardia sp. Ae707_Ps1]|uniref:hypothetical protein n=1 Tax=Pseudonocardia sp. Ae707_Ps1 TaxID=1885572 RepID=UPI00111541B1|nr:hypothetical protein [Pseudonocardia sp. Ae707_Ps1]
MRAARRERQRARDRGAVESSVRRRRGPSEPDDDEWLLQWVYRRSLTPAETDACRLRRKNLKALRLAIEQNEREAREKAMEAARLAKLRRQQDRAVQRLKGLVIIDASSSNDDDDHGSSSDESDDPPPAVDSYSSARDRKGKGLAARKW